jgi:predicted XRE-type DNA-binding protein
VRIKCPGCENENDHDLALLEQGAFVWTCPSCGRPWRVATALTSIRPPDFVDAKTRRRIKAAIKERGFTQAEIGHFLGFSGPYISTLLSGKRKLSHQMARRLLEAAGVHGDGGLNYSR